MSIEVVDMIMGSGKTHQALRYIEQKATEGGEKWIYCTEFLSEIETRTKENPSQQIRNLWNTCEDDADKNKTENLEVLLKDSTTRLIAITHSHLHIIAQKHPHILSILKHKGWNILLDETTDFITPYNGVRFGDFVLALRDGRVSIDEQCFGKVKWLDESITETINGMAHSYAQLYEDSKKGLVYASIRTGNSETGSVSLIRSERVEVLSSFQNVLITTYQFKDTLLAAWLYMHNLEWKYCEHITPYRTVTKEQIATLITLDKKYRLETSKMNLSSNWYKETKGKEKGATKEDFTKINKMLRNYANKCGCKGTENKHKFGYTVPTDAISKTRKNRINPLGYPAAVCLVVDGEETEQLDKKESCHIPCNARASNAYKDKTVMAHVYNRYQNPFITNWTSDYNIPFSDTTFALNEILQWVWRSAIRDGNPIHLLIASDRMSKIFDRWISSSLIE